MSIHPVNIRARIEMEPSGTITHNGKPTRIVLAHDLISVGCSDITPAALTKILKEWEQKFNPSVTSYILQP